MCLRIAEKQDSVIETPPDSVSVRVTAGYFIKDNLCSKFFVIPWEISQFGAIELIVKAFGLIGILNITSYMLYGILIYDVRIAKYVKQFNEYTC